MKRILYAILFISTLALTFGLVTTPAHAQSPYGLTAQVDANAITTDDTVTLTLTLTTPDGSAPRLNLPALDGFNVVGSQTASQYRIVNGQTSASMVYAFQLQPTRMGDLKIPTLHLDMNGQLLATDPLTVHVTQGNGTPTKKNSSGFSPLGASPFSNSFNSFFGNSPFSNDPFFADPFNSNASLNIQALTDKQSVYVGEPLEYTVRVSSDATLLGEPEYDKPKFTGFWAHEPPLMERNANGNEITTLLFPTQAGKLTIDAATIRADGGFFSDALEKQTEPIAIEAKPLPQNAPSEFTGAVGAFDITATPDKTATRVGEPITVKIEIRGAGNFDTLPEPKFTNDADWRAYNGKAQTQSNVQYKKLVGAKTIERTLIPTREGELTIPAVRYAYFDPADAQYHTLETKPIQVHVAPGDPSLTQNIAPSSNNANPSNTNAPANAANAPTLKPATAQLTSAPKPLTAQPLFWAMFLVPFGIVALDVAFGLRKRYLDTNAASRRSSRAYRNALKQLRRVRQSGNQPAAVARIVLTYLEDKLNRSLLGVSHSNLAQILIAQGVSSDAALQTIELLQQGEATEFGKQRMVSSGHLVTNATEVLTRVEEEWAE